MFTILEIILLKKKQDGKVMNRLFIIFTKNKGLCAMFKKLLFQLPH